MNNKNNITNEYKLNIYVENSIINKIKDISEVEQRKFSDQIRYILKEFCENYKK